MPTPFRREVVRVFQGLFGFFSALLSVLGNGFTAW